MEKAGGGSRKCSRSVGRDEASGCFEIVALAEQDLCGLFRLPESFEELDLLVREAIVLQELQLGLSTGKQPIRLAVTRFPQLTTKVSEG